MSEAHPLETTFDVRFCETDALGHVGNTVLVQWFEAARDPVFAYFVPTLDIKKWPLILASYHVDFHHQLFYGTPVTVKTYIKRIGRSSFVTQQEVWQNDQKCATGLTTLVNFDYQNQCSSPISDAVKDKLSVHLLESDDE